MAIGASKKEGLPKTMAPVIHLDLTRQTPRSVITLPGRQQEAINGAAIHPVVMTKRDQYAITGPLKGKPIAQGSFASGRGERA